MLYVLIDILDRYTNFYRMYIRLLKKNYYAPIYIPWNYVPVYVPYYLHFM